mgnify:CR=1 FL=1
MKTIKFNGKPYSIPENWQDVSVGMLIKAQELSEILEEAPIIAILSAYTSIPVSELRLSLSSEVQEILAVMSFISVPYEPIPGNTFTLDNIVYECEADIVNQNFEDFVSVQTALYNNREEPHKALPRLLAILCKRDGETLQDFDLNVRSTLMLSLPMTDAKNVEAFFLTSLTAYRSLMFLSSTHDIQEKLVLNKLEELKNTMKQRKVGNGISFGMKLRIGYFRIILWWVKRVLVRYFNSGHSKSSKNNWMQTCRKSLMKLLKRNANVSN